MPLLDFTKQGHRRVENTCKTNLDNDHLYLWEHAALLFRSFDWYAAAAIFTTLGQVLSSPQDKAKCILNAGLIYARLGDYSSASVHFSSVVDRQLNRSPLAYFLLGLVEHERGNVLRAIDCFERSHNGLARGEKDGCVALSPDFRLCASALLENIDATRMLHDNGSGASMASHGVKGIPVECLFEAPQKSSPADTCKTVPSEKCGDSTLLLADRAVDVLRWIDAIRGRSTSLSRSPSHRSGSSSGTFDPYHCSPSTSIADSRRTLQQVECARIASQHTRSAGPVSLHASFDEDLPSIPAVDVVESPDSQLQRSQSEDTIELLARAHGLRFSGQDCSASAINPVGGPADFLTLVEKASRLRLNDQDWKTPSRAQRPISQDSLLIPQCIDGNTIPAVKIALLEKRALMSSLGHKPSKKLRRYCLYKALPPLPCDAEPLLDSPSFADEEGTPSDLLHRPDVALSNRLGRLKCFK